MHSGYSGRSKASGRSGASGRSAASARSLVKSDAYDAAVIAKRKADNSKRKDDSTWRDPHSTMRQQDSAKGNTKRSANAIENTTNPSIITPALIQSSSETSESNDSEIFEQPTPLKKNARFEKSNYYIENGDIFELYYYFQLINLPTTTINSFKIIV